MFRHHEWQFIKVELRRLIWNGLRSASGEWSVFGCLLPGGGQPLGRRKKIRRRQKCLFKDVYFTSKRRSELALASASSCSGLAGNFPRR